MKQQNVGSKIHKVPLTSPQTFQDTSHHQDHDIIVGDPYIYIYIQDQTLSSVSLYDAPQKKKLDPGHEQVPGAAGNYLPSETSQHG